MFHKQVTCIMCLKWSLLFFIQFDITVIVSCYCGGKSLERIENTASIVISGHVKEILDERYEGYAAHLEVKRVFKGNDLVNKVVNSSENQLSLDVPQKILFSENYNKILLVSGFRLSNDSDCQSHIKKGDTRIFFLEHTTTPDHALNLIPPIVAMSMYYIQRINAAIKDVPFDVPPPTKSPCLGYFCAFHATCLVNETTQTPYCKCLESCVDSLEFPVCGSDGRTYASSCHIELHSCTSQRRIKLQYEGPCNDPCDGIKCEGNQVCKLDRDRKPSCSCESNCPAVVSHVCGSDGQTYSNDCLLKKQACTSGRELLVVYDGKCRENQGPCRGFTCDNDADCIVKDGRATCECPVCNSRPYDPVCGTDGISYENECYRRQENCKERRDVKVEHRGLCMAAGCDKDRSVCKHYSICEMSDGQPRCVCPSECSPSVAKVCGTDGVTYNSECELRVASCKNQLPIVISSFGDCKACNGIQCKYGSECVEGKCICPQICPSQYDPVCATDGNTYRNDCELRQEACRRNTGLEVRSSGRCSDGLESGSGDGSGSMRDCDESTCKYGGTCLLDMEGSYECQCVFSCDAIRSPVCGSDGVTYGNKCELQASACRQQSAIVVQSSNSCDDMDELQCDGAPPILDSASGLPFQCSVGQDCPPGSYCHKRFGKCCSEVPVRPSEDLYFVDCTEGEFGCCDDHVTFAPDKDKAGCPDQCQCSPIGSLAATCHPTTKQCSCRPGVGGTRCDRCLPGYWGLQLIHENNNAGCMPCDCNHIGASRDDCNQNTGRCECRDKYDGHKCGRCRDSGQLVGDLGCNGEMYMFYDAFTRYTDAPYTTLSRKTPRDVAPSQQKPSMTPRRPSPTTRPILPNFPKGEGRIADRCLEDSSCYIAHSHCHLDLCRCDEGFIPTYENTVCSRVKQHDAVIPEEMDTCSLNPCRHGGICRPDTELGYRCLCALGRTGVICRERASFTVPSFSGSAYLSLDVLGVISGNIFLNITFRSFNSDGMLLFASQNKDGTGQFISIAMSDGLVEFRYDTGTGPRQLQHPYPVSTDTMHQVIVKKMGQSVILIVDNKEPLVQAAIGKDSNLDLSGTLFLGFLPHNMSFIQEKIGVNLGFVGCVQSLTAGQVDKARIYNLQFPSNFTNILDGLDVDACDNNPCQALPCANGGSCIMASSEIHMCLCPKGFTGDNCKASLTACLNSQCHPNSTCSVSNKGEVICHCPPTREGQFCEYEKVPDMEVPEFHGDSFLELAITDNLSEKTNIELWILTRDPNGLLLYSSQYFGGGGDTISINIFNTTVELRLYLGDNPLIIRSRDELHLNEWHRVIVRRQGKRAELIIDDGAPAVGESTGTLTELQLSGNMLIGGYKDKYDINAASGVTSRFKGVIQRIYINGRLVSNPISSAHDEYHVTLYTGPPCNLNPCMNGGVCIPKLDLAECKCPTRYIGQLCEKVAENLEANMPVRFNGNTHLQYLNEISKEQEAQRDNKFKFRFRTDETSGLLLFQGGRGPTVQNDYVAMAIRGGYLELSYNLGRQYEENLLLAKSTVYVSDGNWHTAFVRRSQREGELQVDKESIITMMSDAGATQMDTDGILWLGGKEDMPSGLPSDYYRGFRGCIGDVYIKDKELHLLKHRTGVGSVVEFCH
ncbi:agrin-like isoform X3 [Dreissena polymorpha]|uniref:agrin-like isoform X3 n=1 Tax=Dreissena polymorpha TaxID=45954 RepID=UPI002264564E|nr:agrin-like isoform X3 [Dreissena polymorpha]